MYIKAIIITFLGSKTLQIVKVPEQISSESASKKRAKIKIIHQLVARDSIDRKMRGLVLSLRGATSDVSQLIRLEELCRHLTLYPEARSVAIKVCSWNLRNISLFNLIIFYIWTQLKTRALYSTCQLS